MKDKKMIFLIIGVIVFISIIIVLFTYNWADSDLKINISSSQNVLSTQTSSEGLVTVKVTPKDLLPSFLSWDFEIILDTHSGNLDQDLIKTSVLIDDKGNQFNPISWEGDPPQGHHRQGILKFNPIFPRPKSIELIINQVGGISERSFKWQLR